MRSVQPKALHSDDDLRRAALTPNESWMLQAPAGSGKTELLMQRFLACLAAVDEPESVLAITFTRKAAAEMRNRILAALQAAAEDGAEEGNPQLALAPHEQQTRDLAQAVLAVSKARGWNLLAHPARLQIRTLDSFCEALAQRAPFKDRLGGVAQVTPDAQPLYELAAERLLRELGSPGKRGDAVAALLRHLDADVRRARTELARMLERREQWLHLLGRSDAFDRAQQQELRQRMEEALALSVEEELEALRTQILESLPLELAVELFALLRYRAELQRAEEDRDAPSVEAVAIGGRAAELAPPEIQRIVAWPEASGDALPAWRAIAAFLILKNDSTLRKRVDSRDGFPADTKEQKAVKKRVTSLLERVAALPAKSAFCSALHRVRSLPAPRYTDDLWEFMLALLELLPLAAAHLQVVFAERGVIDFAEYAQRALDAIGPEGDPTELGLQLGYRVRHILVDEFQDTNRIQIELLARLVASWEEGEHASTFLVGDPMQSIYAFRQADVAIFQRARREGIAGRPHQFGSLRKNFRSQAGLVEWFNQSFRSVLGDENEATNAVRYAEAEAVHPAIDGPAVEIRAFAKGERIGEAQHVAACIRKELDRTPSPGEKPVTIAVLVRSRSHLPELAQALREAEIRFRAVKTDRLSERPLVRDLEALRAALTDLADRTAWLAVLRAPWCGLELADLWELCHDDEGSTVRELLRLRADGFSPQGRAALERVLPVLDVALQRRGRTGLRSLVEEAWLRLGGPSFLDDPQQGARDAACYFALLDELGASGAIADPEHFAVRLDELFAPPDPGEGIRVEITTIHNAKGLEWDVVFLPALERSTRGDEKRLLYWRPLRRGGEELLLLGAMEAQNGASQAQKNGEPSIESYLRRLDREAAREERKRLLYVAATRARRRLYLSACHDPGQKLKEDSILRLLWEVPGMAEAFTPAVESAGGEVEESGVAAPSTGPQLRRLPPTLALPPAPTLPPALTRQSPREKAVPEAHEFRWVGELARRAGIVVHAFLQRIATEGVERWNEARLRETQPAILAALKLEGVGEGELRRGEELVSEALRRTLRNERGRWLLAPHPEARCEWALTALLDGELERVRVDRTFLAEGVRWLIDYKLSPRLGGGREAFLAGQLEKYRPDLERYARVLRLLESGAGAAHPLRCALYFPLMGEFCEVKVG